MKRTLISFLAAMFVAAGASAATLTLDIDATGPLLTGDTITITATVEGAGETFNFLDGIDTVAEWNTSQLAVSNGGSINPPFGAGTQTVIPGLDGGVNAPNTFCSNAGNSCIFLSQANVGFTPVNIGTNTATASLTFDVIALAGSTLTFGVGTTGNSLDYVSALFGSPGSDIIGAAVIGGNLTNAINNGLAVVPEPGTAAMVGLGLIGLASVGRRRN